MRRLIGNSLLLALLVLVQLAVCAALSVYVCPPTRFEQKLRATERCPTAAIEVAIGGASRAYEGLDPIALAWPAYNFGDVGQSPNFTTQVLLRQLERFPRLRCLVIVIDEWGFGGYDDIPTIDYERHGYRAQQPDPWRALQGRFPLLRYRRQFLGQLLAFVMGRSGRHLMRIEEGNRPSDAGEETLLTTTGFLWTPAKPAPLSDADGKARVEHRRVAYNAQLRQQNRALYRQFLEMATARGVQVAIVLPPLHAAYRKYADPEMQRDFEADLATVLNGLPAARVRVFSYTRTDFAPEEYQDTDHLNGVGAFHWTSMLSDDLSRWMTAAPVRP